MILWECMYNILVFESNKHLDLVIRISIFYYDIFTFSIRGVRHVCQTQLRRYCQKVDNLFYGCYVTF